MEGYFIWEIPCLDLWVSSRLFRFLIFHSQNLLSSIAANAVSLEPPQNTASLIYSLFTSVVECHSRLLLQHALQPEHRATVVQVVALLLQCAATPGQYPTDETTSNIPFAVWFTIQVSGHYWEIWSWVRKYKD